VSWPRPRYSGPERRNSPRWRPRRLRFLLALFAVIVVSYGAAILWLISQETRLVFEAGATLGPARPPFPYEQIDLPRPDGARQFAWVMRQGGSENGPWVLYLHGNAANIASGVNISHYRLLRSIGLNVVAPEYLGFSGLDGVPTEAGLEADARAAYDYLRVAHGIPASRIVVYGWSLGSAVAIDLASHVDQAALILEGAPASIVSIGEERYPFFPIRLLMRNQFESVRKIDRIRSPALFLHSPEDAVIPIAQGRRLFEAAGGQKTFVEVRGGHVQASEVDAVRFAEVIAAFLREHGLPGSERTATSGR
jgi:hypothetical protein